MSSKKIPGEWAPTDSHYETVDGLLETGYLKRQQKNPIEQSDRHSSTGFLGIER